MPDVLDQDSPKARSFETPLAPECPFSASTCSRLRPLYEKCAYANKEGV